MLPTLDELNKLKQVDIRKADPDQLVDLRNVEINEKESVENRLNQYIEAVHNPYLVKIGDYIVKFSYQDSGEGIEEKMLSYVSRMAKIKCQDEFCRPYATDGMQMNTKGR